MTEAKEHADNIKKLNELIKDIRIAMLTTIDEEGHLRSRPMGTQQTDFDGDLWFFTGKSTEKVGEIQHEQRVNVSYSDPKGNSFVSISGTAKVTDDKASTLR